MYICTSSDMHPYECTHDKYCEHCTWADTEWHNHAKCALCAELGARMVDEPFATQIKPYDLSHRKTKITVNRIIKLMLENPQKELPF